MILNQSKKNNNNNNKEKYISLSPPPPLPPTDTRRNTIKPHVLRPPLHDYYATNVAEATTATVRLCLHFTGEKQCPSPSVKI